MTPRFLPTSPDELRRQGARRPDVVIVTGDAYVDHVSFGAAVVGRLLESFGLAVVIAAQPDWRDPAPLRELGEPRLFVGVTAGNMDSMVNHLTAFKKRRHDDAYSPGGRHGLRPNRASVVYAHLARRAFPDRIVLLGGVETSLRRFVHYDYWSDSLRRSILLDARADLLVFGMAERPLRAIVDRLAPLSEARRVDAKRLYGLRGTAFAVGTREAEALGLSLREGAELGFGPHGLAPSGPDLPDGGPLRDAPTRTVYRARLLPSLEEIEADPRALAAATTRIERSSRPGLSEALVQRHGEAFVVAAPPAWPLQTGELDLVHELPFVREAHPGCEGPVPALESVFSSIQVTRGCPGGCSFCALGLHEGGAVQSRSVASVLREVGALRAHPRFRGIVSDLGGATANVYGLSCRDARAASRCRRPSCLHPRICPLFSTDHGPLRALMRAVREADGVRRVVVSSGVRHDLAVLDPGYLEDLVRHHVGGHLHVAPEHSDPVVLRLARKPPWELFEEFRSLFEQTKRRLGAACYLNPYFLSGLPGSTDEGMRALVASLRAEGWRPRQVQGFIPTPGTVSTAIFYSGVDPDRPGERVATARTLAEKLRQHAPLVEDLPADPGAPGGRLRSERAGRRSRSPRRG
jgi:uncharacterized radical SAM protein YgiQ